MCWEQGSERLYLSVYIMAHVNLHTHRHRGARQLQGAHHKSVQMGCENMFLH